MLNFSKVNNQTHNNPKFKPWKLLKKGMKVKKTN